MHTMKYTYNIIHKKADLLCIQESTLTDLKLHKLQEATWAKMAVKMACLLYVIGTLS